MAPKFTKFARIFPMLLGLAAGWSAAPAFAQGGSWTTKTPMPTIHATPASGVSGGLLFVVGGGTGGGTSVANEAYDPATDTWTTKASAPTARSSAGSGVVGGKLYVVGGCINSNCGSTSSLLEVYDPATNTWTSGAPMPTPRSHMAAAAIGGKLYVAGGQQSCGSCTAISTLEEYDPATDTWTARASLPAPSAFSAGAAVNGLLYVVGGITSPRLTNEVGTLQVYDPATDTWSMKSSMPTPRHSLAAATANGIFYAFGGQSLLVDSHDTVESYDPASDTWTTKPPMPTSRFALAAQEAGGSLYAVGGIHHPGTVHLSTLEAFRPITVVGIDVKPGSFPNSINLGSAGVVPVAILSSSIFDARELDPDSITLAGARVKMVGKSDRFLCHEEDVSGDGLLDLVCQVETAQFMIETGDSTAVLEGETFGGVQVRGEDSVRIVP